MSKNTLQGKFIIPFIHSSCLLPDDPSGGIASELCRTNQECSSVNIILPWFSMLIYDLGDEQ
jgi:hypothetical protein